MDQVKKRILIDALISSGIHSKIEVAKVAGVSLATVNNVKAKKKSASSLTQKRCWETWVSKKFNQTYRKPAD